MSVTLSLRVTSDKRKPATKMPNSKEENLVPIIEILRSKIQPITSSCQFLDELEKAGDVKSQLETLRKGLKSLKLQDESGNQDNFYIHFVVEILLSLGLKSSLRNGIIRILKEFREPESIIEAISEGLKSRFSGHENDIMLMLHSANAVCGCFENFPAGTEAVAASCKEALTFILGGLIFCEKCLSAGGCTVQNTEVCQCVHALVRAGLHVTSLEQSADWDRSQLHQLAKQLMACTHLPLDTRTNCGLLTVATGRHAWLRMLEDQLSSEDDLSSLCLYSGIIGCLAKEELTPADDTLKHGESPIQLIFEHIIKIHKRNPLQPTITLSVARTLVALSRVLVVCSSDQLSQMLPALLSYTWEHLEHVMDSVKHLAVSLLHNIVKLHSPELDVYSSVLSATKCLPAWGRARHTALSALLGKVPVSLLVSGANEIRLMYRHLSHEVVSSYAVNAFQELMRHHYVEISNKEEWKDLWILPLLYHLDQCPSIPLQQVLSKALAISPDIVQYVLRLPEGQVSLGTRLLCLRLSHKAGLLDMMGTDGEKWRGVISYDVLHSAMTHSEDQTRLSCLSLVVESPKTSEVFTSKELLLVVSYVANNLHWESPASRQRNIALLGKFVSRFNDSYQALQRRADDAASQLLTHYCLCKQQLEQCCVDSLFPGATYSRRVSALHLLLALRPAASPQLRSALLASLADSYEDVKAMAVKLLTTTAGLLDDFNSPTQALHVMDAGLQRAGGVKPPECLSAAYLLATLSHVNFSKETLTAVVEKYPYCDVVLNQNGIKHQTVLCLLLISAHRLTEQLEVAEANLLKASASAPLHGLLFTIRLLLAQIKLKECRGEPWRQLIRRLVNLGISCSAAVASVVNNDSPEGHFPMDFDFDPSEVCGGGDGPEVEGVTSQMVLLCSWRTVKEVSLLLGCLVGECDITPLQGEGLVDENDVLRIGHHLTTLLAETKHRGAFEQAYVGFCKLVSRLWRLPVSHLQQLPMQWLKDTMDEISSDEDTLCATRRSAGIPFMIQALICTQMEAEGPLSVEGWVRRLLELAKCPTRPANTHTHALNILRALFRSTQLGEAVAVCVERAFMVTITAFSASNWMERNSATLLLSALMTRVFGVPRTKSQDSLSWKNKMTGRIFFQRYPQLFGFFQRELLKASQSGSKLHPSLYPVLLVLGRLYPSSLEGTDSNVQLTQYIPAILLCSGSNVYKTRTLAARAMAALMTLPHFNTVIEQVTRNDMSANLRHGLLLQVAYFLKQSDLDQPFFRDQAENWIVKLASLFGKKLSCPELEALFNVINVFFEKYFAFVPQNVWIKIAEDSQKFLKGRATDRTLGACLLRPRICELLLKFSVALDKDRLEMLCCHMLEDPMYEVRYTVLNFLDYFCNGSGCSDNFDDFYRSTGSEMKNSCKTFLLNNSNITEVVAKMAFSVLQKKKEHPEDKVRILSLLRNWEKAWVKVLESNNEHRRLLTDLLDLCRDSHDEVATAAMYCLITFIKIMQILNLALNEEDLAKISEVVRNATASETSYLFDEPIYLMLIELFDLLQKSTQSSDRLPMYKTLVELSEASQWPEVYDRVVRSEGDVLLSATLLLGLALGQFAPSANHVLDVGGRVFDKEEVNSEYEEFVLSNVCGQKLKDLRTSHKNVVDAPLEPSLRLWLAEETGLDGGSLAEVIALARMRVLQLDTSDPCQFLNPGYQRLRLSCLKLKNIV